MALVVVALAVPTTALVVGGAVLQRADEPAAGAAPGALPTEVALAPRRVPPRVYPTSGEFVPPVAVTPTANPGAAPTDARRTTRPSDSPRKRQCPSAWRDVPPLVDWCKRHGYSTD